VKQPRLFLLLLSLVLVLIIGVITATAQWVTRDERWPTRGPWLWAVYSELPQFYRELNGIDFGHAYLAETLLHTQDVEQVEKARLEVLDFIFSSPTVPPDEEMIAPTLTRMIWEAYKAFNWAHSFHRSVYDLYASDRVADKDGALRQIFADYIAKPEAITSHRLDLHNKLWSFPESKAFRNKFQKFNTQIWSYHWLQAATYDVQLLGNAARQRELMPKLIGHYHGYLKNPPVEWQFMPMMAEGAPKFAGRFPEIAAVFDNLHMLHDNIDDILSRPDLYPTLEAKRAAILKILPIYLHRNHVPNDKYATYHLPAAAEHAGMGRDGDMKDMGPRPPTAQQVLAGMVSGESRSPEPAAKPGSGHQGH
jgi:hypothetical protein